MRILVGITGGSGVIYAIRLLEVLKDLRVETHLIMTAAAQQTIVLETERKVSDVGGLATKEYRVSDITAPPASGTFKTDGMVVIPCSMKTLGGIAAGYADNLVIRAAETTLKERRPLVLVPRETPLTTIHIENMLRVANAGGIIVPAMPGFYNRPKSLDQLIDHMVGKVLDLFKIEHKLYEPWAGPRRAAQTGGKNA